MVYVQDPATSLALSLLDGNVSGRVLDACAAPGGKTIMLSDLAGEGGLKLTAADRSPQRLRQLNVNLKRAGVRARTVQASAQENPFEKESFDLILADVPCSNSGVIRRRPDAPWLISWIRFHNWCGPAGVCFIPHAVLSRRKIAGRSRIFLRFIPILH